MALRDSWSPSFSRRWTSIQYFSRPLKPRRFESASWSCSHCLTMIAACWTATAVGASIRYRTKVSAASSMKSMTSSSGADQRVDLLAVERGDERRLEPPADLVAELVAAMLRLADLAGPLLGASYVRSIASKRRAAPRTFAASSTNRS